MPKTDYFARWRTKFYLNNDNVFVTVAARHAKEKLKLSKINNLTDYKIVMTG